MEIDITLAVNNEYAVLIEAKSTLKIEDVEEQSVIILNDSKFRPKVW